MRDHGPQTKDHEEKTTDHRPLASATLGIISIYFSL